MNEHAAENDTPVVVLPIMLAESLLAALERRETYPLPKQLAVDMFKDHIAKAKHGTAEKDALHRIVSDWQANGNSRELGDPTAATWHEAARQLLAVLNGKEPTGR